MLSDRPIRLTPGDLPRKWLFDDKIELIIWFDSPESIHGFQILYDLSDHPKALTVNKEGNFSHQIIDSGEQGDLIAKGTPIITSTAAPDLRKVVELFRERSSTLPEEILDFVIHRIDDVLRRAEQGAAANP